MSHLLEHITWHALSSWQAQVARGTDEARRYAPGELGEYFGCFEDGRLVAMAGERMWAGAFREISGVCTHPDFQGRGLARRLMRKLIRRQMQRGETPFLHVMRENAGAHKLYDRMGFPQFSEPVVRVVSRSQASGH